MPGEANADARDAFIIAEAARTMPHTLRSIQIADEQLAELTMLCGFDDDLAKQATATSNRFRGLLTQIHPALEHVLGPRLDHPAVLDLLRVWSNPEALRHAGQRRFGNRLTKLAPRMGTPRRRDHQRSGPANSHHREDECGHDRAAQLVRMLADTRESPDTVFTQVEALVEANSLHPVLASLPAVGVGTAARILTEDVGKDFASVGHLASYARQAPVTWRSGSSIRSDHPSRKGNRILKRALFLSAFAALKDPLSRAYRDRKRAEGKRHNQALIALARRRCDTL